MISRYKQKRYGDQNNAHTFKTKTRVMFPKYLTRNTDNLLMYTYLYVCMHVCMYVYLSCSPVEGSPVCKDKAHVTF